jgi:methylamine dehydrogenase accessory protein MauD
VVRGTGGGRDAGYGEAVLIATVVWVLRLLVAGVFGLAAWGKFADLPGTRQAVAEFGVPARFVPATGWALPSAEAAVAVAVLPPASARWAACGAVLLLAVFTAVVGGQLARGRRPGCACFGAVSSRPVSGWTLVRNGVLTGLAGLVIWGSLAHPGVPSGLPGDRVAGLGGFAVLGAVVVWQGAAIRELRRQATQRTGPVPVPAGLAAGAAAPGFDLPSTEGGRVSLGGVLSAGLPVLLMFFHPGCGPCERLAGDIPRWRAELVDAVRFVLIGSGTVEENQAWAGEHQLGGMLVQERNKVMAGYQLTGFPSAVLIDPRGRLAAPVAAGSYAVRDLIAAIPDRVTSPRP